MELVSDPDPSVVLQRGKGWRKRGKSRYEGRIWRVRLVKTGECVCS